MSKDYENYSILNLNKIGFIQSHIDIKQETKENLFQI